VSCLQFGSLVFPFFFALVFSATVVFDSLICLLGCFLVSSLFVHSCDYIVIFRMICNKWWGFSLPVIIEKKKHNIMHDASRQEQFLSQCSSVKLSSPLGLLLGTTQLINLMLHKRVKYYSTCNSSKGIHR
jgi:hypothetical protein